MSAGDAPRLDGRKHLEHGAGLLFTLGADTQGGAAGREGDAVFTAFPAQKEIVAAVGAGGLAFFAQDEVGVGLVVEHFRRLPGKLLQAPVRSREGVFPVLAGNGVMQEQGRMPVQRRGSSFGGGEERFTAIENGGFDRRTVLEVGREIIDAESQLLTARSRGYALAHDGAASLFTDLDADSHFRREHHAFTEEERSFELLHFLETAAPCDEPAFLVEEFHAEKAALLEQKSLLFQFSPGGLHGFQRKGRSVEVPAYAGNVASAGQTEPAALIKEEKLPLFVLPEAMQAFRFRSSPCGHTCRKAEHEDKGK